MFSRRVHVIDKCFDDAALGDSPAATTPDHAFEFDCQCLQARDPAFHLLKLPPGDAVDGRAGAVGLVRQAQQLSDSIQREAQFPAVADECQSFKMLTSEAPLVALGARRIRHQADLLVVADRLDLTARLGGKLTDRKTWFHGRIPS